MRCRACDVDLSDFECSITSDNTGEYLDLCSRCLSYIRNVCFTSENFLLYDPDMDDLDTQYHIDTSISELIREFEEDDSAEAINSDGVRISESNNES